MNYTGKLFGKVGNKYFDTGVTSEDYDAALAKIDELAEQVLKLNLACVTNRRELLIAYHESQMPAVRESHSKYIEICVDKFLDNL